MNKLAQALTGITKLGIDTSPFIYFIERHPVYLAIMQDIIQQIEAGKIIGYSSVITLTEVLVHPKRLKKLTLEEKYRNLLQNSRNFKLIPIDANIASQAAELRAHYNLRTPDTLQIAATDEVGCQAFLTNDKDLKKVTERRIILLDDLLE
jgi:predicted nucleic acid-binding protein